MPATADDASAVLIGGGDGTIDRYLAQLVELRLPLLVVPRGSGNDFARALKIRSVPDALGAWRSFAAGAGNTNSIDLGVIAERAKSAADLPQQRMPHSQYFCCVGGVGRDEEINRRANLLPRWLRTHAGYALCLPSALLRFVPRGSRFRSRKAAMLARLLPEAIPPPWWLLLPTHRPMAGE